MAIPGLPGGLIIYQGNLSFCLKGHLCSLVNDQPFWVMTNQFLFGSEGDSRNCDSCSLLLINPSMLSTTISGHGTPSPHFSSATFDFDSFQGSFLENARKPMEAAGGSKRTIVGKDGDCTLRILSSFDATGNVSGSLRARRVRQVVVRRGLASKPDCSFRV